MAKLLDKDPFTYQKERDAFLKDLHRFHVARGTSYVGFPSLAGKEVDLYLLYGKVTQLGGWAKVTDEQRWEDIQELFNIPLACTNSSQALKIIYVRYLSHYEKIHHFGEDPDRIRDDQLDDNSVQARKKTTGPVGGVPMCYNYGQHNIPDHIRQSMGLKAATGLVSSGDYKNLVHSLMSGLPNEVDFALNICTLLSNEGQHTIELRKCPHILKLLLAHMGIYEHDHESLSALHEKGWKNYTKRNYSKFWYDSVEDEEMRKFLMAGSLDIVKLTKATSSVAQHLSASESNQENVNNTLKDRGTEDVEPDLTNVFALGRGLGIRDVEGQRILQLAMIIRNLSFEKENTKVLSRDLATFRFLMLCIHSKYNALRQLALDTLSNIALEMVLRPAVQPTTKLVFQLIAHCITSPDKFDVISGLDMLARLCQVEANEEVICDNLGDSTYEQIVHLLTIHDIQLIVYSLETLYQLSELGEVTTTHIAAVRMAVETLVNLVTVEAQAYGPESLVGIRVVEHVTTVPVSGDKVVPTASQASIQQQMAVPQSATQLQPESKIATALVHPNAALVNMNSARSRKPLSIPARRPSPYTVTPASKSNSFTEFTRPAPVITPPPVTPSPAALTKAAVQPLKAHTELDSDTLACNWLQAHYEFTGIHDKTLEDIPKMELYGEFLTTCGRLFIKNIANANSFANCVRMTFSKVESIKMKRSDGTVEQIYRGLKKRDVPLPFPPNTDFAGVMTPVHNLQRASMSSTPVPCNTSISVQHSIGSHPSTPNRPAHTATHGNTLQSPPISPNKHPQAPISPTHYPTIQQALLGGRGQDGVLKLPSSQCGQQTLGQGSNSTLIKSLLANKVSQNISRQQGEQVSLKNIGHLGGHLGQLQQGLTSSVQSQQSSWEGGVQMKNTLSSSGLKLNQDASPSHSTPLAKSRTPSKTKLTRNRNNGHDVVITNSKAIEDLIESVARQGSVESDDEVEERAVIKCAVPDIPEAVVKLEDVGKKSYMQVVADGGSNNSVSTRLTTISDQLTQSMNGADTGGCAAMNGEGDVIVSKQSTDSSSTTMIISSKTKPQVILNGVLRGLGNGKSGKLAKAKSKDIETPNNKICESATIVNSQAEAHLKMDARCQGEHSEDHVTGCGDGKTISSEGMNDILENGFGSATDRDYHLPQLDGTHDTEETKPELSTVSAQQSTTVQPVTVTVPSSLKPGEAPACLSAAVTAPASQPTLPIKVVYTQALAAQGHLLQSTGAQTQIQMMTSAGRALTYVPQPQAVQGQSQVLRGQPQVIQGQPQVVQGQPQVVQGQRQVIQAQPQVLQGQVQGQSATTQAPATLITGQNTTSVIAQPGQTQVVSNPLQLQQQQLQLQQQQLQMQLQQLQQMQQQIQQQWIQTQQQLSQTVGQQSAATTSQGQVTATPTSQNYIVPKVQVSTSMIQPMVTTTEQTTTTSQTSQMSTSQQQAYILPKPQSQQTQQQQPVQMLLRPQQLTQQMQAVNQQASLAMGAVQSGQAQSTVVGLPVSVQQVNIQQPQNSQSTTVQAQPQISVQATRFVLPQGQVAVRPHMSTTVAQMSQYAQVQHAPQATTTLPSQTKLIQAQSQAAVQPQAVTGQTQVIQAQARPTLVQGQTITQQAQPQVIQQAVRTHLVQQPHVMPTHGQPQVLAQAPVMQQHFLQQRQLVQQCAVTQQGQVVQSAPAQNVIVSGASQAQLSAQAVLQRAQYVQNQVLTGQVPSITTQSQLLQGQPRLLQTQAQFLPKGQLVQPGSAPQLIQQTTASGAKVTVMVPSQQQLLQYQQVITSQQQLLQKQLATSMAPAVVTSSSQPAPAVSAPTIQIPVSQLTLPISQSSTTQPTSIASSPVSTPPPPSPQMSKPSLPSPNTQAANKKKRSAVAALFEKSCKKKKLLPCRTTCSDVRPPSRNQNMMTVSAPAPPTNKYFCEWAGCKQWFDTIKLFNRHVIREHFEKQHQQAVCRWEGCDGLRRPKWSLMTHLQDRHLNDTSLKNPAKKLELTQTVNSASVKTPPPAVLPGGGSSGPVPVYPENAALQAIKRFAAKPPFPEFAEMKEGPVTKHIRLTSALVLRNLARYSALGRSLLKKHEERLSFVALSTVEASSPIANCLWELHQTDPH